jgi:uncharacterized protein
MTTPLSLATLPESFAVCRLASNQPIPAWALSGAFTSITRTTDELSIVCPEANVPPGVQGERGWRAIKIAGPLDFSLVGVLTSLLVPLAEAGIAVFTISTYETDYVLVKEKDLPRSVEVLTRAGHKKVEYVIAQALL